MQQLREECTKFIVAKLPSFSQKLDLLLTDFSHHLSTFTHSLLPKSIPIPDFSPRKIDSIERIKSNPIGIKHGFELLHPLSAICIAEEHGILSLYSSTTFKKLLQRQLFPSEITHLQYIPTQKLLFISSKNKIKVLRISSKHDLTLLKSIECVNALGFMLPLPSLNLLISTESLSSTTIRDLNSLKIKGELKKSGYSAFFIEKFGLIAMDHFDGLIGIWDVRKRVEISRVETGNKFTSVLGWGFCESRNLVVAGLNTGAIKVWNLSGDSLIYVKEKIVHKIKMIWMEPGGKVIFTKGDKGFWGYNVEENEVGQVLYGENQMKEFKVDVRKRHIYVEQSNCVAIMKYK